jgi:tetratricopeptide (TPR) repeat protein
MSVPPSFLPALGRFLDDYKRAFAHEDSLQNGGLNAETFTNQVSDTSRHVLASAGRVLFYQGMQFHRLAVVKELSDEYVTRLGIEPHSLAFARYFEMCGPFKSPIDAAERLYRMAIELDPGWLPARFNLAKIQLRRGDREGARADLEIVSASGRSLAPFAQWSLATIFEDWNDDGSAEIYYRAAVAKHRHFGVEHRRVADFFRRTGKLDDAAKHYQIALEHAGHAAPEFFFTEFDSVPIHIEDKDMASRFRQLLQMKGWE